MSRKITELINGFQIEFTEENLVAKITRIRTPSDGQVKGQLEIKHSKNGTDAILLVPTQFNFSSEQTRTRFAKSLGDKLGLEIEWRGVFDYLGQKVQELARSGDTYLEIWTDAEAPPPERWLGGILYKGVQNIIFGEKGVSKSTFAYILALCLALPWTNNPLELEVPNRSIKTLVLDWETDKDIFGYYTTRLRRGMNVPVCSLYYRRCTLPLIDDIEPIQAYIEATGVDLLIIDSLGAAAGGERGELKGSEAALMFNTALRKLKKTSLIIAQTAKGDPTEKRKTIFGSTYFTYYARNIFELCRSEDSYDNTQHFALFHRECNLGRRIPGVGLRIEYSEDGGIQINREAMSVSEFMGKVTASSRILELLKTGKMTSKALRESLDISHPALSMALKRLSQRGKVIKVDDEWGLLSTERS